MIKTIARTIRAVRLGRGEMTSYVRGYLDQALEGYGYVRNPAPSPGMALPLIGAFGMGVAVGTGLGVLIAPASGDETRATLRRRVEELMRTVQEAAEAQKGSQPEGLQSKIITDDPEITHGGPMGH